MYILVEFINNGRQLYILVDNNKQGRQLYILVGNNKQGRQLETGQIIVYILVAFINRGENNCIC